MDEYSYKKFVVSKNNLYKPFLLGGWLLSLVNQSPDKWYMIIKNKNKNSFLKIYIVGYSIWDYKYLYPTINSSHKAPWVNSCWLPNWCEINELKVKVLKSLKKKFLYIHLAFLKFIFREIFIIKKIIEFLL
jgi:hypothetical protein